MAPSPQSELLLRSDLSVLDVGTVVCRDSLENVYIVKNLGGR